jgi:hypothetical protein
MGSFSFRFVLLFLLSLIYLPFALADSKEYTVFDARKTLPLSDTQPVYRDYYVNMGVEAGVKVGSVLAVYRKIPVIDVYTNKVPGDLIVEVGKLQVIQTQRSLSVGRLLVQSNPKAIPVVQFEKVMLGDRVALSTSNKDVTDRDDEEN